ncbi:MAG: transposase, partial [Bradymonadales bacterium]|nr:transposase [Bradymonadales bacterium]
TSCPPARGGGTGSTTFFPISRRGRSVGYDVPAFLTFLKELLVPQLRKGHIVVMDNLRPHHSLMVQQLIEQAVARVLNLPPYSHDFNPIELCWSKIKALLRKYRARTRRALDRAVGQAMDLVTPSDTRGWFAHCGYAV